MGDCGQMTLVAMKVNLPFPYSTSLGVGTSLRYMDFAEMFTEQDSVLVS